MMEPDVNVRRAMLEERRDTYKRIGYDCYLEAECIQAQHPGAPPSEKIILSTADGRQVQVVLGEAVKEQRRKATEAYAGAKRCQQLIDELPREEPQVDAPAD